MDGNGRWAKNNNKDRIHGHKKGVESVKKVVEYCANLKIKYLTLFTFSSENWKRPTSEVIALMKLLCNTLDNELNLLLDNNIKLNIIGDMKKISTENLNFRLKEPQDNEELRSLTSTFNNMLNRLETSFETQKNFISNASHELNTPLTSIIGEADVTLAKERSKEEYIISLKNILEDAGKLDKKTKALLFLAQTGYDGKAQTFISLRIDELVIDVKETVEKIYPEAVIHLDFDSLPENPDKLTVNGNTQLLHLAISNVVMNACKYSKNRKVNFALAASDKNVIITVKDKGIGIPENELPYIFDPFFRGSNTENFHGYGIGLPLTRNVIKMHNGSVIATSSKAEGTIMEIKIPIAP